MEGRITHEGMDDEMRKETMKIHFTKNSQSDRGDRSAEDLQN